MSDPKKPEKSKADWDAIEAAADKAINTPPPCPPPDRAAWLLTGLGSFGRVNIGRDQYEELRGLAIAQARELRVLRGRRITFEEAWAVKEAEGYQYGEDALEQVRFGWELARQTSDAGEGTDPRECPVSTGRQVAPQEPVKQSQPAEAADTSGVGVHSPECSPIPATSDSKGDRRGERRPHTPGSGSEDPGTFQLCGNCHTCEDKQNEIGPGKMFRGMILCPTCGNKRCPKATDCTLACSGSNEPGQEGSVYGNQKPPRKG